MFPFPHWPVEIAFSAKMPFYTNNMVLPQRFRRLKQLLDCLLLVCEVKLSSGTVRISLWFLSIPVWSVVGDWPPHLAAQQESLTWRHFCILLSQQKSLCLLIQVRQWWGGVEGREESAEMRRNETSIHLCDTCLLTPWISLVTLQL